MNTNPYMSKYEYTRIIGIRALQLSKNSPALVDTEGVTDPLQIAKLELKHGKLPFIIERPLPNGESVKIKINDLKYEQFLNYNN